MGRNFLTKSCHLVRGEASMYIYIIEQILEGFPVQRPFPVRSGLITVSLPKACFSQPLFAHSSFPSLDVLI